MTLFDNVKKAGSQLFGVAKQASSTTQEVKINPSAMMKIIDQAARAISDPAVGAGNLRQWPQYWFKYHEWFRLARDSDLLRTIFLAKKNEIFRNGIEIIPKEGNEESGVPIHEEDEPSGLADFEMKDFESFLRQANANGQSMIEVLKEVEEDLNTVDDAYLACQFEYKADENGRVATKRPKEFFRLHPINMHMMIDRRNRLGRNEDGNKVFFSPLERGRLFLEDEAKRLDFLWNGVQLFPAHFRFSYSGGTEGARNVYYAPWEVLHKSKYAPSLTYSTAPPLLSVWMKIWTLLQQDKYIMDFYSLQRPPKFFIAFKTDNPDSLSKAYKQMIELAKQDPHIPPVLAISSGAGGQVAQVVDMMRPLEELKFIEHREEVRRTVGALFGVMPIFQADLSQSGGLNNEGLQITVTNRSIEADQEHYNNHWLRWITKSIGSVKFELKLRPSEEQDEVAELQRQGMKIQNARAMHDLGYEVKLDTKTGEFSFHGQIDKKQPVAEGGGLFGEEGAELPETGFGAAQGSSGAPKKPSGGLKDFSKADKKVTLKDLSRELQKQTTKRRDKGFNTPSREGLQKASVTENLSAELESELNAVYGPKIRNIQRLAGNDPVKASKEIKALSEEITVRMRERARQRLQQSYDKGFSDSGKELRLDLDSNPNRFESLFNSETIREAIEDLTQEVRSHAFRAITESLRENDFSLRNVKERLKNLDELSEAHVGVVARTESNRFMQAGRREGYQQAEEKRGEKFLYIWRGPDDARTTDLSKRIKSRVGNGVTWEELVQIVHEESKKDFPEWLVDPRAPVSHYQSRHFAVRVVQ